MSDWEIIDPTPLSTLFDIPPDLAVWPDQRYRNVFDGKGKRSGSTPVRARAAFGSHDRCMTAISGSMAERYRDMFGIYMLTFTVPEQWFYVGIAAPDTRKPEGVLSRILKHRIKATGSHVGTEISYGGVNHTVGWRVFAPRRYRSIEANGGEDRLADAWLSVARPPSELMGKKSLEKLEDAIVRGHDGLRASVFASIPGWKPDEPVNILNAVGDRFVT